MENEFGELKIEMQKAYELDTEIAHMELDEVLIKVALSTNLTANERVQLV